MFGLMENDKLLKWDRQTDGQTEDNARCSAYQWGLHNNVKSSKFYTLGKNAVNVDKVYETLTDFLPSSLEWKQNQLSVT